MNESNNAYVCEEVKLWSNRRKRTSKTTLNLESSIHAYVLNAYKLRVNRFKQTSERLETNYPQTLQVKKTILPGIKIVNNGTTVRIFTRPVARHVPTEV